MAPDTPASCSLILESKASALEGAYQTILQLLRDYEYTEDDIFAVHLALEEAFYNAVEHGNKKDPEKTVQLDCTVSNESLEIQITDQGTGFNPGSVPDPRVGENLYRPEGRGILLINAYMDSVHYNDSGNRITMQRMRVRPAPSDAETS